MGHDPAFKPRPKKRPHDGEVQAQGGWSILWREAGGVGVTPEATDNLNSFSIPLSSLTEEFLLHVIYMKHVLIPLLSGLCLLLFVFISAYSGVDFPFNLD